MSENSSFEPSYCKACGKTVVLAPINDAPGLTCCPACSQPYGVNGEELKNGLGAVEAARFKERKRREGDVPLPAVRVS